jgi:hypothetical protein
MTAFARPLARAIPRYQFVNLALLGAIQDGVEAVDMPLAEAIAQQPP